ncbi:hypothetical protein ISN34_05055 [Xanthomonas translucens pv. translucens]|uniref:Transcriptional regulator n=1 Tax=Xanthomonas translucens pv. translucens TaxID=134875 RepID=A0ABW9KYY6_XANCT|nr:hypothetical protein [Xanthomonas translucens]QSQ32820.1 hypothetical protein ISN31_13070 [Xanthomonas translucens pv. translucens]QSQ46259.1 hypothetical protein ISN34_05055 [Xanthomonas translucens pv. translucens]UKE50344.1 hypothetical protein KCU57_16945 [Xanthomonas translucens]
MRRKAATGCATTCSFSAGTAHRLRNAALRKQSIGKKISAPQKPPGTRTQHAGALPAA